MRTRLAAYRLNGGLTWLEVAQDILDCEATELWAFDPDEDSLAEQPPEQQKEKNEDFIKPDEGWPITQEVLRKFVEGERKKKSGLMVPTTPRDKKKLVAIRDFLIHQRYLSELDLARTSESHALALSLSEYFSGSIDCDVCEKALLLEGVYRQVIEYSKTIQALYLQITISDDAQFCHVSLHHIEYAKNGPKKFDEWGNAERKHFKIKQVRFSGWSVFNGPSSLLFFVKPVDVEDSVTTYLAVNLGTSYRCPELNLVEYPFGIPFIHIPPETRAESEPVLPEGLDGVQKKIAKAFPWKSLFFERVSSSRFLGGGPF